jgi:hypothetical protein
MFFTFQQKIYEIRTVWCDREVNYLVYLEQDYVFRLVPDENGFRVSILDKALSHDVDEALVSNISAFISQRFA